MHVKPGYLLIEVMVVMALVIVIVMLAIPQMSFLKKQLIFADVNKIAALCLFLRQRALVTQQDQKMSFDREAHTFKYNAYAQKLCSCAQFGVLPFMHGPPSNPNHLIDKAITFIDDTIIFFADGTISSGTIYIKNKDNSACYALTIPSAQAPFIRLYEYDQRWILLS